MVNRTSKGYFRFDQLKGFRRLRSLLCKEYKSETIIVHWTWTTILLHSTTVVCKRKHNINHETDESRVISRFPVRYSRARRGAWTFKRRPRHTATVNISRILKHTLLSGGVGQGYWPDVKGRLGFYLINVLPNWAHQITFQVLLCYIWT